MTTVAPGVPRTPIERLRWAITDSWTLTVRGLSHWVRQPTQVIVGLSFSILLVVMFGYIFGGAMTVPGGGSYNEFMLPGMFVMTMAFGIGETMVAVTTDADKGVTDRFRSMPMSPIAVVLGRCTADMFYATTSLAVMIGCGLVVGWRWNEGLAAAAEAVGLLLLLRFSLLWLGIYLGLVIPGAQGVAAVQTLLFPVTMITNTFAAPETMPNWLGGIAAWNPLSSTVTATRDLFGNPGVGGDGSWITENAMLMAIVWPALLIAIFFPLSVRQFRRLSR